MIFSTLINQYLAQDPEIAQKLSQHQGKILQIELLPFGKSFFIFIHESSISISQKSELPSHTTVSGTPLNLLSVWFSQSKGLPEDISITGDAVFVQDIRNIFKVIDIDWTEILSKITNDPVAYTISQIFSKFYNYQKQTKENLNSHIREYLQEEYQLLVSRTELEDFYKDVDYLRDSVERLCAKIEILNI
jgi:ubiquinone biosynthesis protein UbiJ